MSKKYIKGDWKRQSILETALNWISEGNIESYMQMHQNDENADELKEYFTNVIEWVDHTFYVYRDIMKNIPWGILYNEYKNFKLNPHELETEISSILKNIQDGDQIVLSGIYETVLARKAGEQHPEQHMIRRTFSKLQKYRAYEDQEGICPICHNHFDMKYMEAHHKEPYKKGGKTTANNCEMICKECHQNLHK